VIECEPNVSDEVVSVATPPLSGAVPRIVAPSLNVTVPVGEVPVTVAAKVTAWPTLLGFGEELREVDAAAKQVAVTVEVLPALATTARLRVVSRLPPVTV
jgi:hypothetical protein